MYNIEYDIELDEHGLPYISLPENVRENDRSENRFYALEMTLYMFTKIYNSRPPELDEGSIRALEITINTLKRISGEAADILSREMSLLGDAAFIIASRYHIKVNSIKDRNNLPMFNIFHNGKIFRRQKGLKVLVDETSTIYELIDGIENENWIELNEEI